MSRHLNLESYKKLSKKITTLTESESVLHTFILNHFEELSYYGIIDLAEKVKVSKATIGRFLNKLGYTGYAAFKQALKNEKPITAINPPIKISKSKNNGEKFDVQSSTTTYLRNIQNLIEDFSKNLDINALDKLSTLIADKNRKIFIVGPASSKSLAIHLYTLLMYSRSEVVLLPLDTGELPKALLGINQNDILIAFSYYRFNPVVLEITKLFSMKNSHVTVITNTHSNPYGIYSSNQYVLPSDADSIFQSRTIGFLFVELLISLVQQKTLNNDNFDELEGLFRFFGSFSSLDFK